MRAFGKFEKGVENAIAGAFRVFQSELKPVEIITALKKAMDANSAALSRERAVAPNVYTIYLAPGDMKRVNNWDADTLTHELERTLIDYATEQDFLFVGPLRLYFQEDTQLREGTPRVDTTTARGSVAPATSAVASEENPLLQVGHERYLITGNLVVIGRGSDCDITVDDSGVSRHHLELKVTPHGVIATDLNSTNGSFVEGHRISAATLVDGNTLTIGHTQILFWTGQ
ncbi:DUF3662 and FHA domain-containing protein [Actinotignum urinale]|uniref:DUF3662 and FHA domain-containing protein n=1 Tax=Actinotignum urinale TaxID=190146 RepID=A0AAW9HU52_9ACTO|nr:DUF3662 and FHA domain-containing protein [Actinotignum urinale]MDY5128465.1 DUF3662 and FHA domain-containing protein [Actinotignum urinale]MDY5132700.1 DUF3662 and FHA domain-containing protein [Actinotignum urinale]MDY5151211.1 DUF3662 and FHA domain-containing protein [Actinotignum urinale]MDY5155169.1 DUF3662 and FHA domain-containing protein [Actinotignum urinale]MDY5160545.1 DUF3662 and FHA domain-containing protein [Actinotignum urinale]